MAATEKQKANLIKNSERSPSELREQTRRGGIRSGEVRRERRDLKKSLSWMLSLSLSKDEEAQLNQVLGSKEKLTQADAVAFAVLSKARKGEPQQLRLLAEMIGLLDKNVKMEIRDLSMESLLMESGMIGDTNTDEDDDGHSDTEEE